MIILGANQREVIAMTKIVIRKPEAIQLTAACYTDPACGGEAQL